FSRDWSSDVCSSDLIGLTYNPRAWFSQHLGVGSKQTVVARPFYRRLYNLRPDQPVRVEVGLESRTKFEKEVFENVVVKSSLGLRSEERREGEAGTSR